MGVLGEDCAQHMNAYQIYTRLSKKKDKSKDTRNRAAAMAQDYLRRYQSCVAASAAAAAPVPAPVTPIVETPVAVTPVPYVPIDYGGGSGGGTAVQEATPPISTGVVATGQMTSSGLPIYYNQSTGQSFYYDSNGQPVYYNPVTSQWGTQVQQALTPVPYVQMPTSYNGGGAAQTSYQGQAVPVAQPSDYAPAQYVQMPGYEDQAAIDATVASGQELNEADFASRGKVEYFDQWGPIRVIKLVIPKKAAAAPAAATQTASAPVSASVYGGQALPGGQMNVEDFTAQYALDGGWW
jgi:hypothetical protein